MFRFIVSLEKMETTLKTEASSSLLKGQVEMNSQRLLLTLSPIHYMSSKVVGYIYYSHVIAWTATKFTHVSSLDPEITGYTELWVNFPPVIFSKDFQGGARNKVESRLEILRRCEGEKHEV